jgi:hypothetical protein
LPSVRTKFLSIDFDHQQLESCWLITSPQLPGWKCSAPSRDVAIAQVPGSLRSYLRTKPTLADDVLEQLQLWVGSH